MNPSLQAVFVGRWVHNRRRQRQHAAQNDDYIISGEICFQVIKRL